MHDRGSITKVNLE
jgi:hypothetical protein